MPRISEDQRAKNRAKAKSNLLKSGVDTKEGEKLVVAVPDKDAVVDGKRRVFYRVVAGDTVHSIAKAFGVREKELVAWNAIEEGGKLHPKMVVLAWVSPQFDADLHHVALLDEGSIVVVTRGSAEHLDLAESRAGRVRSEYVAKGKEKLAEIAKRYGLGSHDLARINRMSYDAVLEKGQKIIVYEVKDPGRSARAEEQWKKTPRARRGKVGAERAKSTTSAAKRDRDRDEGDGEDDGPVTSPTQIE